MKHWITFILVLINFSLSAKARERIVYDLKFGIIKSGEAVMVINDTTYNGNKAINYHLKGHTTGFMGRLYRLNDIYESTVDAQTYLPYRALRNVKEQNYRYFNEAFFFHDKDSVYSEKSGGVIVPHNLTDFLTVFFYFIKRDLIYEIDKGNIVVLPTWHGDDYKDVKIKFIGFEQIKSKMGLVDCYVLSPVVDKGRVLKRSDGLKFYISKDDKIPIQLDFETKLGTLSAVMVSYKINGKEQIKE